jgi:hypothetical protein
MKTIWTGGIDPIRGPFITFRVTSDCLDYTETKHFRDLFDDPEVFWKVVEKMAREDIPAGIEMCEWMQQDVAANYGNALDNLILYGKTQ